MTHLFLGLDPKFIREEPYIPTVNFPPALLAAGVGGVMRLPGGVVHLVLGAVALGEDARGRGDEPPEDRFLLDDPGVVLDVPGAGNAVGQGGDVGGPSHRFEVPRPDQLLLEGDLVDGGGPLRQALHALVDLTVGITVEVAVPENLLGPVDGLVLDEDRAQDGSLGVQAVREALFEGDVSRHRGLASGASVRRRRLITGSPPGAGL